MNYYQNMFWPITNNTNIIPVMAWYNSRYCGTPIYNFGHRKNNTLPFGGGFGTGAVYNFGSAKKAFTVQNKNFVYQSTPVKRPITSVQTKPIGESICNSAQNYIGYNEADNTFKKFSNDTEWCADFVTYVVKEAYKKQGKSCPSGFGSWRTENIKQWAIDNNVFIKTAGKSDKEDILKTNVSPGNLMIMRENGASHIAIVTKISADGTYFNVIEGNVPNEKGIDCVKHSKYYTNDKKISGFVQLT